MLAGIASQIIWITFSPVLDITASHYGVSQADVGLLSAVFPLVYLIISIPVGYFIDRYGFRSSLIVGSLFLAVFSTLRVISWSFTMLLIAQVLAGIGQPFIMNSISKLVRAWFPEEETALATGLGTLSLMLGIIIGLVATPLITLSFGLESTLLIYSIYSIMVLFLILFLCKEPPKIIESREMVTPRELLYVVKTRNILLLSIIFFLGVGAYTAFTTWVEPVVESLNIVASRAGVVGSMLTVGGILGSIIIPALADKYSTRKKPMISCLIISIILWSILYTIKGPVPVAITLFLTGFFFVSLAPLALDLSAISVGELRAGAANSMLWEFSQMGSLILIVIFESIGSSYGWIQIFPVMSILALIILILAIFLQE